MQGKTKRLDKFEAEGKRRPLYPHLAPVESTDGLQFKADELAQIDRVSWRTADETLNAAESGEPRGQGVERGALADRSTRDRLYHRQEITGSMLKLSDEHALAHFGMDDIGNIDKCNHDALGHHGAVAVRRQTDQIVRRAIFRFHSTLECAPSAEHALDVLAKAFEVETARQIRDRTAAITGKDVENPCHSRRETTNRQRAVQEYGGYIRALEQVLQVAIGPIQRFDLVAELGVDRVQFLVDGLKLLLGGLELLIGRLHLLVDGDQFLIGRLQFFERGFVFLDHRLKSIARLTQFPFDMERSALLDGSGSSQRFLATENRPLVDEHDHVERLACAIPQRFDENIDDLIATRFGFDGYALSRTPAASFHGLTECRSQVQSKPLACQCQQLSRGCAGRHFQVFSGLGGIVNDVAIAIGDDMSGRKPIEDVLVDRLAEQQSAERRTMRHQVLELSRLERLGDDRQTDTGGDIGSPAKDAVLLFDRHEQFVELADIFRRSEEEVAIRS